MRYPKLFCQGWFSAFESSASTWNISKPQFPHWNNRDIKDTDSKGLPQGLKETKSVKC